jgi:long-chain acyl-CoA synthetase
MELAPPLWELVRRPPESVAVEDAHVRRSWRELDQRSAAVVHLIGSNGLVPGDHLVIVGSNRAEYLDVVLGALRGGFVFTTAKAGWTSDELGYVLDDAGSRLVATDLPAPAEAARQRGLPVIDLAYLDAQLAPFLGVQAPYDRSGWKLTYTSGTTGRPKGVVRLTQARLPFSDAFPESAAHAARLRIPADGPHLVVSRLCHGAPLTFALSALASGAPLRVLDRWEPLHALEQLDDGVASTIVVPTMLRQWLALPVEDRRAHPLPSLRTVVHGGEPCPTELKRRAIEWLGPILVEYWGSSEGGLNIATTEEWQAKPGTVGRPVSGDADEVRILGPNGERLPAGAEGRVFFRASSDFAYLGDPAKTAAAHHGDSGTAGDIGWVDADGYLFISGRTSDVIICAGVNVYPAEVENLLADIAGVREYCIVGGPDPDRGEAVVACIVPAPGVSAEEAARSLREAAALRVAGYKQPRRVVVFETLPRDETGKLLRASLRRELFAGTTAFAATTPTATVEG